jgi:hypothetical protein
VTRLHANTRPIDTTRSFRALIAWLDGDKLALDTVLADVMADPVGVPGLLFDLLAFGCEIGEKVDVDLRDHLRDALLQHEREHGTQS